MRRGAHYSTSSQIVFDRLSPPKYIKFVSPCPFEGPEGNNGNNPTHQKRLKAGLWIDGEAVAHTLSWIGCSIGALNRAAHIAAEACSFHSILFFYDTS